jgi:hypothetical protein
MTMGTEEADLARLEEGRIEAENTEAERQARYLSEDERRTRERAAEDAAVVAGAAHREEVKAALEASLAERMDTPEKRAADEIADLRAKVEALEAASAAVHKPDPAIPVV